MAHKGQCLCGDVSFEGKGKPSAVHVCHCKMCARWHGGPAMGVEFDGGIDITGAVKWFGSSDWGERGFCETCGSSLFYRLRDGTYINTAIGFLDDPDAIDPVSLEIYIDEKPGCYDFANTSTRLTGAEFLTRLQSGQSLHD